MPCELRSMPVRATPDNHGLSPAPFRLLPAPATTPRTMAPRTPIIGVMGPGDWKPGFNEKTLEMATSLGKAIAEAGYLLLTGGRSMGVMAAASRGAKSAGGTTIGVLPTADLSEVSGEPQPPLRVILSGVCQQCMHSQLHFWLYIWLRSATPLASAVVTRVHLGAQSASQQMHQMQAHSPMGAIAASTAMGGA